MKNKEKIIEILKKSKEPISGEFIAKKLGISRTAVWKNIQCLKKEGFQIKATHRGYKIINFTDFINKEELKELPYKIYYFKEVSSTMDVAKELGDKGEEALIIAEIQTSGRGRLGRSWISSLGGIWMSLVIKPQISLKESYVLNYIASLSVGLAIQKISHLPIRLKWPNDVLCELGDEEKKIAGILLEIRAEMDQINYAIIGIGINVNNEINILEPAAISLKEILKKDIKREKLIKEVIKLMHQYLQKPFFEIISDWKNFSSTIGRLVKVIQFNREIQGWAINIAEDGALILKTMNGNLEKIYAGDCIHLRY